jgi:hypothetical protein
MADHPLDRVLGQLDKLRKSPSGWVARCPAHDDRNPSKLRPMNYAKGLSLA